MHVHTCRHIKIKIQKVGGTKKEEKEKEKILKKERKEGRDGGGREGLFQGLLD